MNTTLGSRNFYPDDQVYIAIPVALNFWERVWYCLTNRHDRVC